MRVTHVITRLIVGGAQENTIATVLGMQGRPGLETDLISGPSEGAEGSLESLFDSHPGTLRHLPSLVRPVHPWRDVQAWRELTGIFRATRPAMVHTHSGKAGILGRLAARRAGVPVIVHTIHGPSFGAFQGAAANAIFTAAERMAGRVTTHFISVAHAMTRQYLAAGIGRPDQYTRIFSGFPLEPFLAARNDLALRQKLGIGPSDIVVSMIARLFKLKGHDDLLDAAPELVERRPELKFLLIGDGPWRERLEARTRAMGLTRNFIFTGLVPPAEIPRYLGVTDILVHLSRREGLARALSQSLAAGKPVIAYDFDGASEICITGETGFLTTPGQWRDKLLLLAGDPALRARLGEQGRRYVRENFSVEAMVANIYNLYMKLADAHGFSR
ncbi:MAG TPA: glycosyltransferase [Verrucomicrobiae bacterium]|jgi:glycosyltransferase involved in cell wall biosynthesis|nr:glycosyltransferase [Verrucomicrobiae bacterium]